MTDEASPALDAPVGAQDAAAGARDAPRAVPRRAGGYPESRPVAGHLLDGVPVGAVVGALLCACAAVGAAASAGRPLLALAAATVAAAGIALAVEHRRVAALRHELGRSHSWRRLDALTGLSNHDGITAELDARLAARRPGDIVGVLLCDVDRLGVINHSLGHSAGDEVLQAVAARLRAVVRPGDPVGRLGGDEFVVVATGLRSVTDLDRLAQRILDELSRPVLLGDGSRQVATASIGIAYLLKGEATARELLRDADVARYRAKNDGGCRHVVCDVDLRAEAGARIELARELRQAVRHGELVVQYQPIVEAIGGRIGSVEALVRWRHPSRGLIPPGQFLTVASESGLIIELGQHVLHTACAAAARWTAGAGRPVGVAVNLSERQLLDHELIASVAAVLGATGLPASQLQLEVSEELLAHRPERSLEVLRQLATLGVRLALDDFGTTRGSLRQLKELDMIHTLKLDGAFVADVAGDGVDRTLVSAALALAASLGMEVVAEGVETAEQAAVLRDLGVHHLQGFLFQRPAEAEVITPLLGRALGALEPPGRR